MVPEGLLDAEWAAGSPGVGHVAHAGWASPGI